MFINSLLKYWTYRLFAPGLVLRGTYDAFRELLVYDSQSHELMADLEELYYQGKKEDSCRIAARYDALSTSVGGMVGCLGRMAPGSFVTLPEYFRKFDFYNRFLLAPPTLCFGPPFVLPLTDPALKAACGGAKSATLAELAGTLGLPVPAGFVIMASSFHYLLEYNDLRPAINSLLSQLDLTLPESLTQTSNALTTLIKQAEIPPDICDAIHAAYDHLAADRNNSLTPMNGISAFRSSSSCKKNKKMSCKALIRVAVRSSAINEDGECSFAGQYTTILPVQKEGLMASYLAVLASKYTPEALSYRIHCGLTDEETPMATMVVEMVDSITSGVIYTIDPAGRDLEHLFIHMVQGQGEALVSGRIIPQVLAIDKKTMTPSLPDTQHSEITHSRAGFLTDDQTAELTSAALRIEAHFGRPQDIEWAINKEGEIFFLQTRMLQSQGLEADDQSPQIPINRESLDTPEPPLIKGGAMAALGQGCGQAWCVDAEHPVEQVPVGAILVIRETLPSYVRVLDRVSGVLAELGSVAGHFSTVCREFGVPLLCGLGAMIKTIQHNQLITMDATNKMVYQGDLLPRLATMPLHESQKQLPFYRKLRKLLDHITPLRLVDPKARGFTPESCRSLHDIIRFVHEQAVKTMFSLGDRLSSRSNRSYSRKELHSNLPFAIFVVDVGGGLNSSAALEETITISQVCSVPFLALWTGLNHPSVQWQERAHFDWKHFGETTMGEGIVSASDPQFASYAVLGADYVNLNMRFGYHFTLVDTLCGRDITSNYCQFRFAGGGADFSGRLLRIDFISTLLKESGFQVEARGDLLDARISGLAIPEMEARLLTLGRLLGATKLMDMALHDKQDVKQYVVDFIEATKQ